MKISSLYLLNKTGVLREVDRPNFIWRLIRYLLFILIVELALLFVYFFRHLRLILHWWRIDLARDREFFFGFFESADDFFGHAVFYFGFITRPTLRILIPSYLVILHNDEFIGPGFEHRSRAHTQRLYQRWQVKLAIMPQVRQEALGVTEGVRPLLFNLFQTLNIRKEIERRHA